MRRQGCQPKWEKELFARQLTPRERPKVTLRPSGIHTRSNAVSMPRESESNLQAWNSDLNASGSRTWPKEEIEQSIDLREIQRFARASGEQVADVELQPDLIRESQYAEKYVDLRVDGIPNDETYTDEQYMQRIAEQVQKLVTTKEMFKDDSPRDNILSEKVVKKIHEAGKL